jgi:RimJ/RimL family protein N-acetyltransferase
VRPPHAPDPPLGDGEIRLRTFGEHDVDELVAALQDPEIPRWTGVPSPYTRGHAIQFVTSWPAESGELSLAICDPDDGVLLGAIGVRLHDDGDRVAELGYWVTAPARGRGIATRAIALVAAWAHDHLSVDRVDVFVDPANCASMRAAEKAGLRRALGLHERDFRGGRARFVRLSG